MEACHEPAQRMSQHQLEHFRQNMPPVASRCDRQTDISPNEADEVQDEWYGKYQYHQAALGQAVKKGYQRDHDKNMAGSGHLPKSGSSHCVTRRRACHRRSPCHWHNHQHEFLNPCRNGHTSHQPSGTYDACTSPFRSR